MKTIRRLMILVGLSMALFVLVSTGATAQTLNSTSFVGKFTLPVQAQWGRLTLPAGEYSLSYGTAFLGGIYVVTVAGEAEGSPHGMILPRARDDASAGENVLNCLREGDTLYVRSLEIPALGEAIHFKIPHGVEVRSKVVADHQNRKGNNQIAQVSIGIERVPVRMNVK